jgi:hypothetical protein
MLSTALQQGAYVPTDPSTSPERASEELGLVGVGDDSHSKAVGSEDTYLHGKLQHDAKRQKRQGFVGGGQRAGDGVDRGRQRDPHEVDGQGEVHRQQRWVARRSLQHGAREACERRRAVRSRGELPKQKVLHQQQRPLWEDRWIDRRAAPSSALLSACVLGLRVSMRSGGMNPCDESRS